MRSSPSLLNTRSMLRNVLRSALFGSISFSLISVAAQTTLNPGDVAIVAVNANNGGCGGWPSQSDEFSFVLFKAIVAGTTIDITDNGYERGFAGQWGDSEGLIRLTKTGAGLAAGSLVTVNVNGSTSAVTCTGWSVTLNMVGTGPFDLASAGEQIFMTQGGTWTNPAGAQNMTFVGGRVLYGISTVASPNDWVSLLNVAAANGTQRSGLPPGSLCFSMSPSVGSDWIKYIGPAGDPTFAISRTARQWIVDIDDNTRWVQYASCALYGSSGPNYAGGAITLPVTASIPVAGRWTGAKTTDWFDCKNWDDATVPTSAVAVTINPVYGYGASNHCIIGTTTAIVPEPMTASCSSLTITTAGVAKNLTLQASKTLQVTGTVSVATTGFALASNYLTVLSGTLTAANLSLSGIGATQRGTFVHEVPSNTVTISGNVTINSGGKLDLQGGATGGTLNIGGNYTNLDAETAFDEVGSTVVFNGSGAQSITTSGFQDEFAYLTLNKSGNDLTLNAPILVKSTLTLTSGRIMTSDPGGLLTLTNTASVSGANDLAPSFVHGPMVKIGTTSFTFPIGKNTRLHPASITNLTAGATDAFIAEYFAADPNVDIGTPIETPPLDHISSCEYWKLDQYSGTPLGRVTLSWKAPMSCGVTNLPDLRVTKWDGSMWRDRGNGGAFGTVLLGTIPQAASQETAFLAAQEDFWTLASVSTDNPLPIELLWFDARPDGSEVRLDWATASERDNDYFTIERSANGQEFEEVTRVDGAGNSVSTLTYLDYDRWPLPGTSFYRLRQTDLDGATSVSNMVPVTFSGHGGNGLVVLNDVDQVIGVHDFAVGGSVEVLDMTGRVVWKGRVEMEGRSYVPTSALGTGAYVLRVSDAMRSESAPFVR